MYPTEEELERIRTWPATDHLGLMEYVESLWEYPDFFNRDGHNWLVSTGGWSGNEDIIDAMRENTIFWSLRWYSSRRGGHYQFIV